MSAADMSDPSVAADGDPVTVSVGAAGPRTGSITFIAGPEGAAVQALYTAYTAVQHDADASLIALEALFEAHPFMKAGAPTLINTAAHTFSLKGYKLHIPEFR